MGARSQPRSHKVSPNQRETRLSDACCSPWALGLYFLFIANGTETLEGQREVEWEGEKEGGREGGREVERERGLLPRVAACRDKGGPA